MITELVSKMGAFMGIYKEPAPNKSKQRKKHDMTPITPKMQEDIKATYTDWQKKKVEGVNTFRTQEEFVEYINTKYSMNKQKRAIIKVARGI